MTPSAAFRSPLIWSGALSFVLLGVAQALYGPALPAIARLNGITPATAGLILSAHAAGGLLALLFNMLRGGVTGRHALGLLALGAGLIAGGWSWLVTLLGAAVLGAGYALCSAVFNRRFLTETGTRGAAMVGALNAVFGIGAIAGPLILVAFGGAPGPAFALVVVGCLAVMPFAGGGVVAGGGAPPWGLLRRPGILVLGAVGIGLEASFVGLGPAGLIARGATEAEASLLASAFFGAFLAGRLSLVWIAGRIAPLTLLTWAFALAGAAALAGSFMAPGLAYVAAGFVTGAVFPSYFVAASAILGGGERVAALILAAVFVGAIVVPGALTLTLGALGGAVLFPILAAYALAAALATLRLARRG